MRSVVSRLLKDCLQKWHGIRGNQLGPLEWRADHPPKILLTEAVRKSSKCSMLVGLRRCAECNSFRRPL